MSNTLIVRNSFCRLENFPKEVVDCVDQVLTYQNDIEAEKVSILKQIKFNKRFVDHKTPTVSAKARKKIGWYKKQLKELLATEFVKWLKDDTFPTGHLQIVQDTLEAVGCKYKINDERVIPTKKWNFILHKDFHPPRYYQDEIHSIAMKAGRGVIVSAVGTGKTEMMMRLILDLGLTCLIVTPSKPLLEQLNGVLQEHFGEKLITVLSSKSLSKSGVRKLRKKPIRLVNIASMASINKKKEIQKIAGDVDVIFIDEIHHSGSKSYTDLMWEIDHIYHRYGFTGTFLRNDSKTLDMWGFLSTKLYEYPAWKAIKEGYLTPIKVKTHSIKGIQKRSYHSEYKANYCGSPKLLQKIQKILKRTKKSQQILILVNQKDQAGLVIHEYLTEQGFENSYISGDDDKDTVKSILRKFNAKKIRILIGSKVIGEGIDIRSTDHLIMAQGGKSEIAIVQAVGRLVRLYKGKLWGYLHDIRFKGTKYLEKHLVVRKDIYRRNFAPKFVKAA